MTRVRYVSELCECSVFPADDVIVNIKNRCRNVLNPACT